MVCSGSRVVPLTEWEKTVSVVELFSAETSLSSAENSAALKCICLVLGYVRSPVTSELGENLQPRLCL